jgi:hypothetical protein
MHPLRVGLGVVAIAKPAAPDDLVKFHLASILLCRRKQDVPSRTSRRRVHSFVPAQVRAWPLNCDVLPLNIKGASRFLRKWPSATLDIERPEALWPETKGQAASY